MPSNDDKSKKIINLSWKKPINHTDSVKCKLAGLSANSSERLITFRLFTEKSYQQLLIREEQLRIKAEKRAQR